MKKYFFLLFTIILTGFTSTGQKKQTPAKEFYQFTIYHYSTADQEKVLDDYLQQALLPALHRMNLKNIGVFKALANDTSTSKLLYVYIPFKSLDIVATIQENLNTDKAYLTAGAAYINALHTTAPYNRIETILAKAFPLAPVMKLPKLSNDKNVRVYELRSYESATEKIFSNKVQMFNEGDEIGLFTKLNFNAIFYSEVIAGSKMPNLMYMTSFENMADRDAHWKSFVDDPFWKKLSSMPEYQNNVSHIDISFLRPVEYSDF
jgi:NIPSNAP